MPKALPTEPITALGAEKMDEACRALAVATTCVHEGNPDAKVTVLPGMDEEDVRRLAELAAARGKTAYPTNEDDFIDEFRPPTLPAAARPAAPMPA